jgi:coenzyme F420-reducing hydrogenase gamma subunit
MPGLATAWLDGCSGCHMSILDMDERLIDLAQRVQVVYGPYVDAKMFPENVDVAVVEGAVSSEEDLHKIQRMRANSKILVSIGDCAVTGTICLTETAAMSRQRSAGQPLDYVPIGRSLHRHQHGAHAHGGTSHGNAQRRR